MKMKKILSRTVAVITTAALLISYGGVMSTEASEYEPDSEEESIVVEEEYTTEDISEDVTEEETEAEAEDEQAEEESSEVTTEVTTDEAVEEDTQAATETTEVTTEVATEATTEEITTEVATREATTECTQEATANASLMASSDYSYTVLDKSKKTIKITGYSVETTPTSLSIPSKIDGYTVTAIGTWALIGCGDERDSLTTITIPSTVTSIDTEAFCGCYNLKKINVNSNNNNFSSKNGVLYNKKQTKLICYPAGKSGSYKIPSGVTSIRGDAFGWCTELTSITIPSTVTNIEMPAFSFCHDLKKINVNSSNTKYSSKNGVLYNKKQTKLIAYPNAKSGSFTIPSSVTSIGEWAFYCCTKLTSVTIPDSVTSIEDYAFSNCTGLTDIYYTGTETKWNKISFGDNWNYNCPDDQTIFYGIKSVSLKSTSYTYDGNAKKPGVVVKDADGNTLSSKYYTVTYKNNKNVGTGTVKIKFKNGYSGTATQTFIIKPKGTTLSSVTKSSKAFTVKWKKQSQKMSTSNITGYQIQYSTSSSFSSGNKTVTVSGYTSTSKKITGLKSNTKYYVRIRTYKSISGTKYYSGWSSAKSVTTK